MKLARFTAKQREIFTLSDILQWKKSFLYMVGLGVNMGWRFRGVENGHTDWQFIVNLDEWSRLRGSYKTNREWFKTCEMWSL